MKISEIAANSGLIFVYFSPGLRLKKKRFSDIIFTIYLRRGHLPETELKAMKHMHSAAFFLIEGNVPENEKDAGIPVQIRNGSRK